MEKTCRMCDSATTVLKCKHGWPCYDGPVVCDDHKPRETPLVDVLAAALRWLWDRRYTDGDESGVTPGYTIRLTPDECNRVQAVLIRHQEEVGDDPA